MTFHRKSRVWSRRELEGLIADGRKIIILGSQVLKVDAWLPYHPGGDKSILHMVGRDASDEIKAFHSEETQIYMQKYVIGTIDGKWDNFLPPIQGGSFRPLTPNTTDGEALVVGNADRASHTPSPALPLSSTDSVDESRPRSRTQSVLPACQSGSKSEDEQLLPVEASVAHIISSDVSNYPSLDKSSQDQVVLKYRQLDEKLRSEGLYQCDYSNYAVELLRYLALFTLFLTFLRCSYYLASSLCLGFMWHLLSFTVHDSGHLGITHRLHVDSCIGIFIADFLGGLSVGWWKRNHNIHHIVTNSPEHDPDIQHMPFFAISSRFFTSSLRSSYYDRDMVFDAAAATLIKYQNYLYYPILMFGRFNLYRLAWLYLLDPAQAPRKGPSWWHRYLELLGQVFFWYWYGYWTLYRSIPTWSDRIIFLLVSHMVTGTLHVQLTLSHFAMSSADLGVDESFAQKMVRTTMDVDCPPWLDFVHGGLQFQVVHHLFPRLPRHNLRKAQKHVIQFCHDAGIPYIIFGFQRGNEEIISRLGDVARQLKIFEECRKVAARDLLEGHSSH